MDGDLPTEFDLIVVGTGIIESIVSAAASRIGKTVLHLDNNEYYGGLWASFNFESINKLPQQSSTRTASEIDVTDVRVEEGETVSLMKNDQFDLENVQQTFYVLEKKEEKEVAVVNEAGDKAEGNEGTSTKEDVEVLKVGDINLEEKGDQITQQSLLKDSRKFNIDLAPKLHYARGNFVELMISSNIARYSEFRSCSRVLTWINNQLEIVPCSRSDVFSNDKVSVIEKRMLMKLLTACLDNDQKEFQGYEEKTFKTYLKDRKLTDNLVHYVLYAIGMCDDQTSCKKGIENTKRFLDSLGRFGKTPFLYSMYGSGEIPQAFCRLSAVFGGVYALNQNPLGLIVDKENKFSGVICGKQRIKAKHLVTGVEKMPQKFVGNISKNYISRAVFLIDRSIMESEKEHLTLLLMPPENGRNSCIVLEMGTLTGTCPKNTNLVHMFTRRCKSPKEDFERCVEKLFSSNGGEDKKPKILWSFYFSIPDTNDSNLKEGMPENVFVCPGPDIDLDYDSSIKKANSIFNEIYPEMEFLPRAPDPEEIIIGEEAVETENIASDNPAEHKNTSDTT